MITDRIEITVTMLRDVRKTPKLSVDVPKNVIFKDIKLLILVNITGIILLDLLVIYWNKQI